jgi:hypothetical protein
LLPLRTRWSPVRIGPDAQIINLKINYLYGRDFQKIIPRRAPQKEPGDRGGVRIPENKEYLGAQLQPDSNINRKTGCLCDRCGNRACPLQIHKFSGLEKSGKGFIVRRDLFELPTERVEFDNQAQPG